jgi:hypothetical protein
MLDGEAARPEKANGSDEDVCRAHAGMHMRFIRPV